MIEFLLNTGSTIEEGRLAKGGSKLTEEYTQECAVCEMNPVDFQALGSPQRVLISTMDGRHAVAVYAYAADSVDTGSDLHAPGNLGQCGGGPGDILHRLAPLQRLSRAGAAHIGRGIECQEI